MQVDQFVEYRNTQLTRLLLAECHATGQVATRNNTAHAFHNVKIAADHALVFAEGDHFRHVRIHGIQPLHNAVRSEEHTSELQSRENLVCRLLLEKKKKI